MTLLTQFLVEHLVAVSQGRIFRKIWLPSFTQKQVVLRKTGKNLHAFGLKSGQKPMKEQS